MEPTCEVCWAEQMFIRQCRVPPWVLSTYIYYNTFFFVCIDTAADPSGPSWLDKIQQTVQNILEAVNLLKTPIDKSGKTLEELPFVYTR